jgi:predicted amidohydrolase
MRAHLIQFDIRWEDPPANYKTVERLVSGAKPENGDLVLLPEMFDTGFSLNTEVSADAGETLSFLEKLARRFGVHVQGGRTVRTDDSALATNRAPIVAPQGRLVDEYAKIHPFTFGREPERFAPGTRVVTYPWGVGDQTIQVCPVICYDLRFPELFREGLAMGAQLFAIGANWPVARQAHWRALIIARAIENQAYVIGVNRTGNDPHLSYVGGSIGVDPRGNVIGELGDAEGVLSLHIEPEAVVSWRREFPAWRDSRLHPGLATHERTPGATPRRA